MVSLRQEMFGVSRTPPSVDRFLLDEKLGAGGMGIVYAARDPRLERKIALKLVRVEREFGPKGEARLLREARSMARLAHPNVVQIYEAGEWEGRVFIAMELVRGRTLAAWLAQSPRKWQEVIVVFRMAGRGLAAAHAAGVVHRDFKPENVLIGDDGHARGTDFGLAIGQCGDRLRQVGLALQRQRLGQALHGGLVGQVECHVVHVGSCASGTALD